MLPSERSDKVNKRIREILDTLNSGSVRGDEYNRLKDECRQLKRYGKYEARGASDVVPSDKNVKSKVQASESDEDSGVESQGE